MDKEPTPMPDLQGRTYDEARQMLLELGFKEDQITRQDENSNSVESGQVIDQNPGANADVDPEAQEVILTVSKGTATSTIPDLTGLSQSSAQSKLSDTGFAVGDVQQESSYTVESGKVTRQNPAASSSATKGSKVSMWISSGYPPEALDFTYTVSVPPKTAGKNSKINIVYTDARGADRDWGTKTINSRQSLQVNMILDPTQNGVVKVYRDGEFLDTFAISYNDAKQGTIQEGIIEPENTGTVTPPATPTTPPADTPAVDDGTNSDPAANNPGNGNGNANGLDNGNNGQGNNNGNGNGNNDGSTDTDVDTD